MDPALVRLREGQPREVYKFHLRDVSNWANTWWPPEGFIHGTVHDAAHSNPSGPIFMEVGNRLVECDNVGGAGDDNAAINCR